MPSALQPLLPVPELHAAIKNHYDGLISLYEDLWGEHIHHGYWDTPGDRNRHDAQLHLVEKLIEFAPLDRGTTVLDAGCGIGASAVHLAAALDCSVTGITLSAEQVRRAGEKAAVAGVTDRTTFAVMDALHTEFADDTFDVVWALESCELMPDKEAFLTECYRVLKPGGVLLVATWCARDDRLDPNETRLLQRIYRDFVVSHVLPLTDYRDLAGRIGFADVRADDWSDHVTDTWKLSSDIAKPLIKDPSQVWKLVRAKGVDIFRFINSVPLMRQAYDRKVMRYGVLRGVKPAAGTEAGR
ncbi:MAG TPA: methyltransferase domain-containing protein [Pseudonocardiaceae bacterium]|jgi:tocopherol O-methyltransferase